MALVCDNLKKCSVKISVQVSGVPSFGSGIVYETPNYCDYNYVLTAKHILQEDSKTAFEKSKIRNLTVHYFNEKKFTKLQSIRKDEIDERLIEFDQDLVIIIIDKNPNVNFRQILVSDELKDNDDKFFSWATFSANDDEIHFFKFERNDKERKRVQLTSSVSVDSLPGISGSGIFPNDKNVLYGIIHGYPNDNFELKTIDCVDCAFEIINDRLQTLNKVVLDTESSPYKRELNGIVVDIHQATINGVCLNLELARLRLKSDIIDDWYHDPLKYSDLLNQDYLFKQFEEYFDKDNYKASLAELFYVPKKKFTLRQALVSPFIDRIMYIAVVGVLAEKLDNAMINSVYAARYNRSSKEHLIINGVEQWKKMQYALSKIVYEQEENELKYNCLLKIDLLNFYDNINKNLLIEKIQRVCETENEKRACHLLSDILQSISSKDLGLPQNSDASALLATFYLNQIDVFMLNSSFAYFRFMDDIRIFCKNKYEARQILQNFEYELKRCHLSVNSQKTEILTIVDGSDLGDSEIARAGFKDLFDLELSKISRYRKSNNYAYLNEGFHLNIELLTNNIEADSNASDESARKLNFALNTIEFLGKKEVRILSDSKIIDPILKIIKTLKDKPWITTQVCKVLNLMPKDLIIDNYSQDLSVLLLDERFNTYSFQAYQIWLLLAKHKIKFENLIRYATNSIEKNDETKRNVIAAMTIYICSVDNNYKRVILRKFGEEFTHGYFQNRIALISLRSFDTELVPIDSIHNTLKYSHPFTNRFKNKDLVYVQGSLEESDEHLIDQLYSI